MTEDIRRAQALESWYATPPGTCLLAAQKILVQHTLFDWARGGRSLLEINCGAGHLQMPLRFLGFDVTGCEGSPALRTRFVETLGPRFLVDPAQADLLPYGDASFDWVLLHLERGIDRAGIAKALAEARRVAAMGLAVLVWNRLSLAGLAARRLPLQSLAAIRLQRRLAALKEGTVRVTSALALPMSLWAPEQMGPCRRGDRDETPSLRRTLTRRLACVNRPLQGCLGALCLLRLDLPPSLPMTATPLRIRKVDFAGTALADGCSDRAACRAGIGRAPESCRPRDRRQPEAPEHPFLAGSENAHRA